MSRSTCDGGLDPGLRLSLREVGTATASNNYFRQIGASIGTAVVGSLFVARLTDLLATRMPTGASSGESNSFTPAIVRDLPAAVRDVIVGAYNDALTPVFLYMAPIVAIATVLLCFVMEKPLATTIERDAAPNSLDIDGATHSIPIQIDGVDATAHGTREPAVTASR